MSENKVFERIVATGIGAILSHSESLNMLKEAIHNKLFEGNKLFNQELSYNGNRDDIGIYKGNKNLADQLKTLSKNKLNELKKKIAEYHNSQEELSSVIAVYLQVDTITKEDIESLIVIIESMNTENNISQSKKYGDEV